MNRRGNRRQRLRTTQGAYRPDRPDEGCATDLSVAIFLLEGLRGAIIRVKALFLALWQRGRSECEEVKKDGSHDLSGIGVVADRIIGGEKSKGRQIMKRSIGRFTYPAVFVIAAAFLCAMAVLGSPAASLADDEAGRIESRIKAFHTKLGITEAQEEQWNKLAQVMRDNATTMHALMKARKEKGAMNAVDDLKSYTEFLDAQSAGLKSFIPPFEELYAAMSGDQKKNADQIFTKFVQKKAGKKKK